MAHSDPQPLLIIGIGLDGVESVTICSLSEEEQRKAEAVYHTIRSLIDQIDKELRGGGGPQG